MYSLQNEAKLITSDITQLMMDYTSIQPDIDEQKVKSAALVAQELDIKRIIGKANFERCANPDTDEDESLLELVKPALCFYTYARLLKMFPGTFTDSGYVIEKDSSDKNVTKTVSNEYSSIGDAYFQEVLDFLKIENPQDIAVQTEKLTPRIRVFGGVENRGSN